MAWGKVALKYEVVMAVREGNIEVWSGDDNEGR